MFMNNMLDQTHPGVWLQSTSVGDEGIRLRFLLPRNPELICGKTPRYLTSTYNPTWDYVEWGGIRDFKVSPELHNCHTAICDYLNLYQRLLILIDEWPDPECIWRWWCWTTDPRKLLCRTPLQRLARRLAAHKEYLTTVGEWDSFQRAAFIQALCSVNTPSSPP